MKLAAFVGLRDEVDLIKSCIEQLRAIGVDYIIVCDSNSEDGSREIVEQMVAADSAISVVTMSMDLSRDGPIFGPFLKKVNPDWLMTCDADEFVLSRSGNIKECPEFARADQIVLRRFNIPLVSNPEQIEMNLARQEFDQLPLIVGQETLSRVEMDSDPLKRWIMHAVGPKVMCRASAFGGFVVGGHGMISRDGRPIREAVAKDAIVAHLPFSSFARFERKVRNIKHVVGANPENFGNTQAWHWKRWVEHLDNGTLEAQFRAEQMDIDEIETLRSKRTIRSARHVLGRPGLATRFSRLYSAARSALRRTAARPSPGST